MESTRLERIVAAHRASASRDERVLGDLVELASATPLPRDFAAALRAPGLSVIAEVKRRSPSAGDLNIELDPAHLGAAYEAGGASCLSVLTDGEFFGGSIPDLQNARSAVAIPVLRKDFTVDERDVADARIMGADAVLLIVAALDDGELRRFGALATELNLTALFEVHDQAELQRAVAVGASVIGVNQRNLHTFEIDTDLALSMADELTGFTSVAESGIRNAGDAQRFHQAGFDAVLVGTSLVTSNGPADAVRQLVEVGN